MQLRRTRHQMYQHINADYYGFRDEEDGVLEKVEAEAERSIRRRVRCAAAQRSPACQHGVLRAPASCCGSEISQGVGEPVSWHFLRPETPLVGCRV